MKIVFNLTILLVSYPAILVGYIVGAVVAGFQAGRFMYDKAEEVGIAEYRANQEPRP